jgi:sec-independent protein translocase protein TatB
VGDLSLPKLLVLAVLALMIFGPDQLPKMASQAGRALRELRRLADGARADLQEGLGPEFSDFDINDLNPKNFVRKHLMDGFDDEPPRRPRRLLTGARRSTWNPPDALTAPGHPPVRPASGPAAVPPARATGSTGCPRSR